MVKIILSGYITYLNFYIQNKTFIYMLPIAGQTAGPNGLTFFPPWPTPSPTASVLYNSELTQERINISRIKEFGRIQKLYQILDKQD